jgi:heme/copper-type cytochrome/quinol oxidase subunit 4
MPFTIIFLGSLFSAIFYELEDQNKKIIEAIKFKRTRKSFAFLLLLTVTAFLAVMEIIVSLRNGVFAFNLMGFLQLGALLLVLWIAKATEINSPRVSQGIKYFLIGVIIFINFI